MKPSTQKRPDKKTTLNTKLPLARSTELVLQNTGSEMLVYDLKTNKAHQLNETAAMIWKHCDGKTRIGDLVTDTNVTKELVYIALESLQRKSLLESNVDVPIPKAGIARRKFLAQAGAMSAIAMPIISSLVAPKAIAAQSCFASGNPAPPVTSTQPTLADCQNFCNGTIHPDCCNPTPLDGIQYAGNVFFCTCEYGSGTCA